MDKKSIGYVYPNVSKGLRREIEHTARRGLRPEEIKLLEEARKARRQEEINAAAERGDV